MTLDILSPEKSYHVDEVDSVTLPGTMGSFQILKNHAPLISSLRGGNITFFAQGHLKTLHVEEGFVEVQNNKITVCIDSIKKELSKK
ncbi:MAG: hypothetical protein PHZ13_03525 [bacterium]|mgnify:FL=1|nr:hypothetical protein [bacterium]MDD3967825.1 hypothetical protein [Proteiniphilum sp.]MDD4458253.1 hypothetical protein [Proteiniphilum sp.]